MISFDPEHTDDLNFVEELCWKLLSYGAASRKSAMRNVVVGSAVNERAYMQTVTLRRVEIDERKVFFHSDLRSGKITAINDSGNLTWLAHDSQNRSQIRIFGKTIIHHRDALCKEHWKKTKHPSRRAYLLPEGPGVKIEGSEPYTNPYFENFDYTDEESEAGFENFVVVETTVEWMDWYYTHSKGNRRASFEYENGVLKTAGWLFS
jgi:pyridoxamine 5'-phosphate oxidase